MANGSAETVSVAVVSVVDVSDSVVVVSEQAEKESTAAASSKEEENFIEIN